MGSREKRQSSFGTCADAHTMVHEYVESGQLKKKRCLTN
jgi:hypothetical protein